MLRPKLQVKRSKYLSQELEKELRRLVLDAGDGPCGLSPQLIVANPDSYCHGLYYVQPDGVEFMFHHNKIQNYGPCACFIPGEPDSFYSQLPQELDDYRIRLIEGSESIQIEPLFAAMVIMKIFLGLEVPEAFRFVPWKPKLEYPTPIVKEGA